ncbi:protein bfr2 [Cladorrhinum samala]|uniref:Protein BFR2 n=1 Tax=Cladorrhinum samala TaxID=585594 RepID=A0AAV9HPQ9_9PEZI|nr:protein bfr2 [Cladorrhinum samala]
MAPVSRKSRSKRFAEYEEKPVKDFDPENEVPDDDDESGSDESVDERAGTEHYVAVGKSKLRQKQIPTLGPEYRGARVSRAALEQSDDDNEDEDEEEEEEEESGKEEYDDPELADLEADHDDEDVEIDSDDALTKSDDEKLKDFTFRASKTPRDKVQQANGRIKKRPTAADFMPSSGDEDEQEGDEGSRSEDDEDEDEGFDSENDSEVDFDGARLSDEDDDEEDGEDSDEDEEDEEDEDEDEDDNMDDSAPGDKNQNFDVRKALAQGKRTIVSAISQAAKEDAQKGMAVRVQRRAFDSILNLRIRLQKALIAANTFNMVENEGVVATKPYQAAEEAAVKLWNTIDSVRHSFLPESARAKVGEKRKRTEIDIDTSSQEIWESMEAVEEIALSHRRAILDKWSERVKKSSSGPNTRNLIKTESQSLVSVLDSQLVSSERLVKRARVPRSCAPAQAAKKVEEDPEIYDDADFYQLLLKELVDQRSADTGVSGESVTTVRWAALKEAKVRKQVDRRASKGRKLRYTVHEKLQNFMAPEDRRSWEEHAIDRLFGTLFGQKLVLAEDEEVVSDEEMGGVNIEEEEEGLKLFRS